MIDRRMMTKKRLLIVGGVLAIPAMALAWWLGSPLFLDTTVNETFPVAAPVATDGAPPNVQSEESVSPDTTVVVTSDGEEATTDPIQLLEGEFMDADSAHRGTGSATIFELEDGSRVLRFEGFEVTNGPDLHVLLVPTSDPVDRDLLAEIGYEDLGKLKGNIGSQNYELPEGFDSDGAWTVVIYCDPFHVVFSTALLSK